MSWTRPVWSPGLPVCNAARIALVPRFACVHCCQQDRPVKVNLGETAHAMLGPRNDKLLEGPLMSYEGIGELAYAAA